MYADDILRVGTDQNKCKRCGQCMSVCPVYQATFREADVARGKLALLECVHAGSMGASERLEEILSRCLLCGACALVCANKVETTRIMQSGREQLLKAEKGGRVRNALFRAAREGNISAKVLLKGGSLLQALACKRIPEDSGLHLRFPLSFFTQRHTVPSLAWKPFLHTIRSEPAVKGKERRIGFFVGCGANYLFPNAAEALMRILRRMGVYPVVPRNQVCCGLPAYASGDTETAQKLAQKNIEAFEALELDAILTVCASCGSHLKSLPSLFSDDHKSRDAATSFSEKHMDAMTFLADDLGFEGYLKGVQPPRPLKDTRPLRIAYHDPCHLRLGQGIIDAPRRILEALPGVHLAETSHPGQCCGHGGEFNLSQFLLSMKILDRRMEDFRKAEPDAIVTGCTGCLLQFAEGISRSALVGGIKVCHPLVLAEKYFRDTGEDA